MRSLEGRTLFITGASRGIGKAIATKLAEAGATVVGTATSADGAAAIEALLRPTGGAGMALDVTDGGAVDTVIPARTGRRHVLYLIDALLTRPELPMAPTTNLAEFLKAALSVINRRSMVFVISDFISTPGWEGTLGLLAQRHELLSVRLFDPLEMELPDMGLFVMQDAETGEQIFVDTHDKGFRKRFAAAAEKREHDLRTAFSKAGVDTLELSTEDDVLDSIMRFAHLRKQRSRLSGGGAKSKALEVVS